MNTTTTDNNGGKTDYYDTPEGNKTLQDLIEYKEMNFAIGNIFKACYRLGKQDHSEKERDLNKILYFVNRELEQIRKMNYSYFEKGYRDVDEAYLENKDINPHHFHYYDSGMIAYKNEYIELYRRKKN